MKPEHEALCKRLENEARALIAYHNMNTPSSKLHAEAAAAIRALSADANDGRGHMANSEDRVPDYAGDSNWLRVSFHANLDDSRPVKWPPVGPWWESGFNETHAICVAYVRSVEQVTEYWPEATAIDVMQEGVPITFSGRFAKPDWWTAPRDGGRES